MFRRVVLFASTLFEKFMNEGICGRFGRIGVKSVAYRPSSFGDDLGESFTVCGFLFLWRHEHMNC